MDSSQPINVAFLPMNPTQLLHAYRTVRSATLGLVSPLDPEDTAAQSMTEASPAKWHLAHTTWFFETFLLLDNDANYQVFHPRFRDLFNSYYNTVGSQFARHQRGLLTRPNLDEVLAYREHVDKAISTLLESPTESQVTDLLVLGLHHEQQHQELLLTDVKHLLSINPLNPTYCEVRHHRPHRMGNAPEWLPFEGGLVDIGYQGFSFAFDNEGPPHQTLLQPFALAGSLVTNREYRDFIEDKGYTRPELWLSDGWHACRRHQWQHPLYWRQQDGAWFQFTLHGLKPLIDSEPVCHVSFYEADAFARWAGHRLPREAEWETIAKSLYECEPVTNRMRLHPGGFIHDGGYDLFGQVWQWTQSPYTPYPGFRVTTGAVGEYNGKFMCNQLVLRGSSCATPDAHARATYRNFFYPDSRWQFSGIRLAKDLDHP